MQSSPEAVRERRNKAGKGEMMKRFGIRRQVAWLTLIPMLILAISMESFFLHSRFSDVDQELLVRGKLIAHQLASSSEYGVLSSNRAFLQNNANGVLQQTDVRGLIVLNSASETLVSAGTFTMHAKISGKVNIISPIAGNEESLWIYQPIVQHQADLTEFGGGKSAVHVQQLGAVIVEMNKLRIEEYKTRVLWLTVLATTLFLAFSFYLVSLASSSITYPIRKLSEAMKAIGEGDFNTRVLLQTRVDELDILAQGLNAMTAQLQQEHLTLRQRVEEATQALRAKKEEAERVSHDKSRCLAVASHDLRQPLHALGLYVAELQRKVSGAEQQRLVGQVENSIEALSTLLNALLDISKLDAGVVVPQVQTCDVNAMLEHVAADYQMLASIKNVRLIVRPFSGYVTSDPLLLERILMNLVSNAIRYTYPNGSVMVACRRRGRLLRIEVRDNGVGISMIDQVNIFREFYQLVQPQLDASKGLGLGLAIVDRLVKLLGHRIELRSAPGKGSVFALEVPVAPNSGKLPMSTTFHQAQVTSDLEIEKAHLTGKRLLVVDDDELVLSSTACILASWGCEVSMATSLAQIEQLLQDGVMWELIISDYQLGADTSGIDVISLVRQYHNIQIPCILVSGDTSQTVLKLARVSGHHLLHKPVRPAKLRSLVVYLLEGAKADSVIQAG
jgi:signal transduction histidine kinase/ActR/RegA family two-component response regulator